MNNSKEIKMNIIKGLGVAVCLSLTIILPLMAQKTASEILKLNEVRAKKNIPMIMTAERQEGRSVSDCIWLVASEKGINKEGKPCLLVKHPAATSWTALDAEIKNFVYTEGFEYKIMCKETKYDDSSKPTEYELTGVDAKEKKKSDLRKEHEKGVFEDTSWDITHFEEVEINRGYLRIKDGQISMSLGCNYLRGTTIKVNEKNKSLKFVFGNSAGMTEKGCGDKLMMEQEGRLFEVLGKIDSYEATENELVLKNGETVLMRLKR